MEIEPTTKSARVRDANARRFQLRAALLLAGLTALTALSSDLPRGGAPTGGKNQAVRSQSGQFAVQGPQEILPSPASLNAGPEVKFVRLDPARLAVMAERVKQALLRALHAPGDEWKGAIFLVIRPAQALGESVLVKAQYTPNGWFYRVELPSEIEPPRLVRALLEVLLQEMADRQAGARPAELPPWLAPGLTAHLLALEGASFILENHTRTIRVERLEDPLAAIHKRLGERLPATLDELNWPSDEQLAEPHDGLYATSAHLLVLQLLRLPGGADALRRMLAEQAARHLNWQFAFLKAFEAHFKNLRETDKWWSLQIAGLSGCDPSKAYTARESWRKLEEILLLPVNIHQATNELPAHAIVPLQTVIAEWPFSRQKPLLRHKIAQLQALRLRAARPLIQLTDDYRLALEGYLSRRDKAGLSPDNKMVLGDSARLAARKAIQQLDRLDAARALLREGAGEPP